MRKLTGSQLDVNEGWAVHVYGGDRRLLCSFGSSHCWLFVLGLVAGGLLTAASIRCEPSSADTSSFSAPKQAPLAID
ncbi:MAG: hypothetical protein IGS54_15995 [Elainella sp. C42_A2020_010]|nr:hypothetical protein [Elainella sp. C42_A2020_010]